MSYTPSRHFSIAGLAAACAITMSLNGAMLFGFDQLASSPKAVTVSHWEKADGAVKQVTLPRVVITARRA